MALTRTASLRLQLIDAVSGPAKGVSTALKSMDGSLKNIGKASPELQVMINKLEALKRAAGRMDAFQQAGRDLKEVRAAFQQARHEVAQLQSQLKSTNNPTAKLRSDLAMAKRVLKETAAAFRDQVNAQKEAQSALSRFTITNFAKNQQRVRDEIKKTTEQIVKQAEAEKNAQKQAAKPMPGTRERGRLADAAVTAAGATTSYYGAQGAKMAFTNAVDMSEATDFQRGIAGLTVDQQKPLQAQAYKIGLDTRFTNADVVEAQTKIFQAGIKDPQVVMGMLDEITQYALAMRVTLTEAAETIRGGMQTMGKDISDPKTARENTRAFVDYAVKIAKMSGGDNQDVAQFFKFGGASTRSAGLPDDLTAAMAVILRKSGLRGDEAGVFSRAAAAKLVAPTNKGRDALAAMGIDYDKFTKIDGLNTDGFKTMMQQKFGKTLTDEMVASLQDIIENGEFTDQTGEQMPVVGDRGAFTEAAMGVVRPLFANGKGKLPAQDAKALAKAIGDFHKYSVDSVDTVGLLYEIMKAKPSYAQSVALFTNQQAGRANILAQQFGQIDKIREEIRNVKPGFARTIGDVANSGLYGDTTKFKGSVETVLTKAGQDWEAVYRPVMNGMADLMDSFVQLPKPLRMLGEAAVAAAAALGGVTAAVGLRNFITGGTSATTGFLGGLASGGWRGVMRFLGSRATLPLAAATTTFNALDAVPHAGMESALKANPNLLVEMENTRRRQALEQPLGFEGGMHRVGTGFGPAALGQKIQQDLSVKATPQLDGGPALRAAEALRARLLSVLNVHATIRGAVTGQPGASAQLGHRAVGGHVVAGRSYIVGERGKEVVTFGGNGYVTPNHKLASNSSNVNHFHIASSDPGAVAREISRILDHRLRQSRAASINGLPVTV